jgi:RND superfamily putative drug exporter
MPRGLDRALPHIDVEGSALVRHVEQVEWDAANGGVAVRAEAAMIATPVGPVAVDLSVPLQQTTTFHHPDAALRTALVWTLAGWRKPVGGVLAVLGHVLPEESGSVRKAVRVVPLSTPDDDAVHVGRYVSTLLIAQADKPWPSRSRTRRAVDQAEGWLSPLQSPDPARQPLARRRVGDLTPLERRLVTLSAAAVQLPRLIVVEQPDRGLDPGAMSWFAGVCAELVHDTDTTVLLVGSQVTAVADQPVAMASAPRSPDVLDEPKTSTTADIGETDHPNLVREVASLDDGPGAAAATADLPPPVDTDGHQTQEADA